MLTAITSAATARGAVRRQASRAMARLPNTACSTGEATSGLKAASASVITTKAAASAMSTRGGRAGSLSRRRTTSGASVSLRATNGTVRERRAAHIGLATEICESAAGEVPGRLALAGADPAVPVAVDEVDDEAEGHP